MVAAEMGFALPIKATRSENSKWPEADDPMSRQVRPSTAAAGEEAMAT